MINRDRVIQEKIEQGLQLNPPQDMSSIVERVTSVLEDSSLTAKQVSQKLHMTVTERTVRKARQDRRPALRRVYGLEDTTWQK